MKRRFLLGLGLLSAALVAIPATVIAQAPPDPPATYYGAANGATVGQKVIAIVQSGGTSTVCGAGEVLQENGKPVYVVDVFSHAQVPGCGAAGRTIRFYFPSGPGTNARMANESATWQGPGAAKRDLTAGAELQRAGQLPIVASDGALG